MVVMFIMMTKAEYQTKYCYDKRSVGKKYFSYDTAANVLNYLVLKGGFS